MNDNAHLKLPLTRLTILLILSSLLNTYCIPYPMANRLQTIGSHLGPSTGNSRVDRLTAKHADDGE